MIGSSSPRPARLAALLAVTCAFGFSVAAAGPAVAASPQLSLGWNYSCLKLSGETVKCWGKNRYLSSTGGQLGNGTTASGPTPGFVRKSFGPTPYNATFSQIGTGASATCGVASGASSYQTAGALECWGYNGFGELGLGSLTTGFKITPGPVPSLSSGVTQVEGGYQFNCAIVAAGAVKCWGGGSDGQLGNGASLQSTSPVSVSSLTGATQLSALGTTMCALISGGTVKCWGLGSVGQLGNGETSSRNTPVAVSGLSGAIQVSAGRAHACALLSGGTVKCWGGNNTGEIGDGTQTNRSTPTSVASLTGVTQISTGGEFSCALLSDETVKCWGRNSSGQLGDNSATASTSPVAVSGLTGVTQIASGIQHSCALTRDGAVKCWGYNGDGELGLPTTTAYSLTPATVPGLGPPAAPVLSGVPSSPTNQRSASIGFTSTTTGATFQCSIDGGAFTACTPPRALTGLADGTHSIAVKAIKDGLESTATTDSWVVDTTPPAAPTLSGVPASLTDATHAVIHFHSDGTGITYECSVDGGAYTACTSPLELSDLANGSHTVSVKATDAAGNTSDPVTASWTVDTAAFTPPYVSLISPDASPTNQTTASIEYDGEPGATFLCSLDGGAYGPCPPAPVLLTGLSDGSHTFNVKQVDGVGRESDPSSVTWTVDTTPPPAPTITTRPSATTTSTSATIGFSGSGEPGATFECKIDGGAWGPCPSNPFTLDSLAVGSHTVQIRETDAVGNVGPAATVNWTVQALTPAPCSPRPTPPTPTQSVTVTRVRGNLWRMNAGAVFNTGGDTRGCAQILTVQVSTAANKPSSSVQRPLAISYANGILAWTGSSVERASVAKPRWMRVENRIGRWSGWVQVK
ncbi:MAG: Ig-like domain-containing protein [Actinomycetes bacterium]